MTYSTVAKSASDFFRPLSFRVCQKCNVILMSSFASRVKRSVRVCGKRVSKADFVEECDCCRKCCANREAAECNVYFRYPVLKYRQAPFDVDKYRDVLAKRPTDG